MTGDSVIVTGPSGVGKTAFSIGFLAAVEQRGEAAVIVVFEEEPESFLARTVALGMDLTAMYDAGRLEVMSLGPLDLSVDETLHDLGEAIAKVGARCLVIDSLSGFELALAPSFREDFRESIYRLVRAVTSTGVTVMMTVETIESGQEVRSPTRQLSFLADDIVQLRYLEIRGEMRNVLNVLKMRKCSHSHLLREYEITTSGIQVGRTLREFDSILGHSPELRVETVYGLPAGLIEHEAEILQRLIRGHQMTPQALADALALPIDDVRRALERMVTLGLAEVIQPATDTYRAIAQTAHR